MCKLLEVREVDLNRDPQNAAALTYAGLEEFATRMELSIKATQVSRDAVLSMTLPVEGIEQDAALPTEILVVRLDIWEARVLSFRRCIQANGKWHRKLQKERMKQTAKDPKNAPLFAVCSNEGGVFGRSLDQDSASFGMDEDRVQKWLQLVEEQISEEEKMTNFARDMAEVEDSVAKVSNAVSVLELAVQQPEEAATLPDYPALWAEAKSELGRLQLELSTRQATLVRSAGKNLEEDAPVAAANVLWDAGEGDPTEKRGFEAAERYSNKLNGQDPSQVFQPEEGEPEVKDVAELENEEGLMDFKEFARVTLCEAAMTALTTMNIPAAQRAFEVLACQGYGLRSPMASFEFMCWLQSTEVCIREEKVFKEKFPEDHDERVQLHLLRNLEKRWPFPAELSTYKASGRVT
eukprot:symbB.v1.2.015813.t1/scaffold1192.1/size132829/4